MIKKKKIATIKNDININGFKNAANIYSISDTAKFGGTIGWINEGQLSKNILSYIEELNIGDVTEPIKTSGGYLILKIKDKKEKSIELDKEIILQNLINYEMQQQFSKLSIIYYSKIKLNNSISE
ncbi:peptidylprolyl isomerase [Candidatus Pelagibacter sp.]|nr:peptidylprolyl isomerase [Candidatus Pelagibacter sp.]